ncbi:hypothetical protein [Nocardia tengchongensis]
MWNRSDGAADELVAAGARRANSVAEAMHVPVVFSVLSTTRPSPRPSSTPVSSLRPRAGPFTSTSQQ